MRHGWFLGWFAAASAVVTMQACSSSEYGGGGPSGPSSSGASSGGSGSGGGSTSSSGSGASSGSSSGKSGSSSGSGSGSSSGSSGDGGDDGGPTPPSCSCAGGPSDCAVWQHVFMTNYGFNDNSCQTEGQHDCGDIAYPGLGPMQHQVATEGAGTYDDPITAAAAGSSDGTSELESQGGATLSPGTIIYNPLTQKYYIMEDQCAECVADYNCQYDDDENAGSGNPPSNCSTDQFFHIDFWMGPTVSQEDPTNLNNCEANTTIGDTYDVNDALTGALNQGTTDGTVIINPPSNLPVQTSKLFLGDTSATGGCWTSTQVLPDQEVCY